SGRPLRLRHVRYVSLSRAAWTRRLVFFTGAVLVGLTAVGFAQCADWSQGIYRDLQHRVPWLPLLLTPVGFALLAGVTRRWF
ncbi:hypothetical protein, partial [Enterobacter bugandensis]|uniref:hypothetical protein n=1 Tax=Enterobacter bugandensis TaxID=881260 RepID=UPI00235EEBD9